MNHYVHRTIFNRSRGCLMAVAETAKSSGKASGESRPNRTSKSKTTTCRRAYPNWSVECIGPQANRSKGYGLPCLRSQFNSALSRSQTERSAPSQTGTFALLGSGDESLRSLHPTLKTRPQLFVASQVSNNSLFRAPASSTAGYFVETDPRFTNYRQWLSSDYMLSALALDIPSKSKKDWETASMNKSSSTNKFHSIN